MSSSRSHAPRGPQSNTTIIQEGIAVNVTLIFSASQALMAARAGAAYVSPFIGRIDDTGHDGMGSWSRSWMHGPCMTRRPRCLGHPFDIPTMCFSAHAHGCSHGDDAAQDLPSTHATSVDGPRHRSLPEGLGRGRSRRTILTERPSFAREPSSGNDAGARTVSDAERRQRRLQALLDGELSPVRSPWTRRWRASPSVSMASPSM